MIVNADSAQVYSDLPVLSAQPTADEQARVPHRLFGYLDGATPCSAAHWAADAKAAIAEAHDAGATPVLVGGTGLYIRTLLEGIAPIPEVEPDLRARIRALPVADAYAALAAKDPLMATTLGKTDRNRVARALEVIESTGRSIADWREHKLGGIGNDVDLCPLMLLPPREWLYARCDARLDTMMACGATFEVETLLARHLAADAPVMRTIGVPEIAQMLAGQITEMEAVAQCKIATRQYAKRQYTWFRNQSPPRWVRWMQPIDCSSDPEIETLFQL